VKAFFRWTRSKLIVFLALAVLMNTVPTTGICKDGPDFGYCIVYHGWPLHSPMITGETRLVPDQEYHDILLQGSLGIVINTLIAYILISLLLLIPLRKKK
jgi:hypothetical protein